VVCPLIVFIAASFIAAPAAQAEDMVPSNLDLMTNLSIQAAEEIVDQIGPKVSGKRLQVNSSGSAEEYQLIVDIFTRILEEKGIDAVHQTAQTTADTTRPYVLDYKVPIFRLTYPKVYRSHLIGGKKVKREANVRISAKLLSDTGDVVWIGESSAEDSDQFPHGDLGRIQEGSYQFVQPEVPSSGWGKIVEPVFVSAIIVGMIYLFFSNQSDS
jgi:hypothetical protein